MECPICKVNLKETILRNTAVNFCSDCLGVWFEEDELRQAKDQKDEELKWLDVDLWKDKRKFRLTPSFYTAADGKISQKLCPKCRLPLYETSYGDSAIKVDLCNLCRGVWLDRGEFEAIVEYLKKKADYELARNYAKNLLAEGMEVFAGPEKFREELADFLTVLKFMGRNFVANRPQSEPEDKKEQ